MKPIIIIPARYASQRLPAKALKTIGGKPLVQHVYERACQANIADVVVATDHPSIQSVVQGFGGQCLMTPKSCATGSDRVAQALKELSSYDTIINLQGDLPLFNPDELSLVLKPLELGYPVATLIADMPEEKRKDPNTVKAIVTEDSQDQTVSRCHWFCRTSLNYGAFHIGVYAYTRSALEAFAKTPRAWHECQEELEQLRFLSMGYAIGASTVHDMIFEVNTPEDYHALAKVHELRESTNR